MTYKTWLKEWLNVYKKPFVKSHTLENIKVIIKLYIPESLKNKKLIDINALDLQKTINSVSKSRTRLDVYDVLNSSFNLAYKHDLIKKDIASLLTKPKHKKEHSIPLTADEITTFLSAIKGSRCENYFTFMLYSGCRRSEGLNLLWEDIDEEKGLIHIRGTKTDNSDRFIPYFDNLKLLFNRIKRKGKKVFNHRKDYVSKQFKKYCPKHILKDLRTTFATRCCECDINIKVAQKWLGHSSIKTTADIYMQVRCDYILSEKDKFSLI